MLFEQGSNVGKENKDLEKNLLAYREPVEFFKERSYVVVLAGLSDQRQLSLDGADNEFIGKHHAK